MANRGDTIDNPVQGVRVTFRETTRDTGGEYVRLDVYAAPGGVGIGEHFHPRLQERFEVLSGTLGARVAGREQRFGSGQTLVVPPGTPHGLWNAGEEEVHALCEVRPALGFEPLLEKIFGLAREGKTDEKGDPGLLQGVVLLRRHPGVTYPTSPPLPVLKALVPVLAPVAGLLGYDDEDGRARHGGQESLGGGESQQRKAGTARPAAVVVASVLALSALLLLLRRGRRRAS
ncbi:MAG: cupin domain-containing protein [Actinomycetota bacterium]|nr:cupin domain-containing protein [Actinomycetota bacterium]